MTIFLWHVAFVYLLVLVLLSYIVYRNTKDRLFFFYCSYVFLLLTYIALRNYYFLIPRTFLFPVLYYYYVQVMYLCVYVHFGLIILDFNKYYPRVTKWIYRYMWLMLGVGALIFVTALLGWTPRIYMGEFFHKFFFPIHIVLALFIIYKAKSLKKENLRFYFLIGSIFYLLLGSTAIVTTFISPSEELLQPVAYFFLAIIVECTFFAIGLGIRIKRVHTDKLDTERALNLAQQELRVQMLQQIEQQEQLNISLQREKELQVLATQVAQLENKVLRSQMNSHFIFNVLNSIKAYIIEENVTKAVTYLNKFSKLMRRVLEASRNENYTLAEEISAIRLYVDIEKMRISDNLTSSVNVNLQQDAETIPFPALLIQPFVENAIWHGLMPSHREKVLSIQVVNINTEILIEILDNGIGYSNSLREKKTLGKHSSHGMDITKERIEQFNKKNEPQISFGIEDRTGAMGTRVWIRIETDDR